MAYELRSRKIKLIGEAAGGGEASGGDEASGGGEEAGLSRWPTLIDELFLMITSHLNRHDHYATALSCVSWSRVLEFPTMWENFEFKINRSSTHGIDETYFAENYGKLFRHLTIHCERFVDMDLFISRMEYLRDFLKILEGKSQLFGLYFLELGCFARRIPDPTYKMICEALADFLGSQNRLKKFEINMIQFQFSNKIMILKRLIDNNRGIDYLKIKFSTGSEPDVSAEKQTLMTEILSLPDLKNIVCDYDLILCENANPSQVVQTLRNRQKRLNMKLRYLNINPDAVRLCRLTSEQWHILKTANLQVKVKISTFVEFQPLAESFIVEGIPLTHLKYYFDEASDYSGTHLLEFLERMRVNECLELLELSFLELEEDLDSIFTSFLRRCKKLERFVLIMKSRVTGLETFLDCLKENKPESLKEFEIFINCKGDRGLKRTMRNLYLVQKPLLESVGIALNLILL